MGLDWPAQRGAACPVPLGSVSTLLSKAARFPGGGGSGMVWRYRSGLQVGLKAQKPPKSEGGCCWTGEAKERLQVGICLMQTLPGEQNRAGL